MATSRYTHFPNGVRSYPRDDRTVIETGDNTMTINTDAGKTFVYKATATITLPAIAIGNTWTIVNDNPDGTLLTISPNASDGIMWLGSGTDDKDLINTAATAKRGDYVTLASLDQTVAWQVIDIQGVWAKQG